MKFCIGRQTRFGVLVFLFCLTGSSGVGQAQKLRVAYTAFAGTFTILWLGHEAGLYQKQGAGMELLYIRSSTTAVQALLGGDVDMVYSADRAEGRGLAAERDGAADQRP